MRAVQTLIFSKKQFPTAKDVVAWLAKSESFDLMKQLDETPETWRARQMEPVLFLQDTFRTIEISPGIEAVVGELVSSKVQLAAGGQYVKSSVPIELAVTGKRYAQGANGKPHQGFTVEDFQTMIANWDAMGRPKIPIELRHHTMNPENPAVRAGIIVELFLKSRMDGQTVLMAWPEWTNEAVEAIVEGKLPNMSVETWHNAIDRRTGQKMAGWMLWAAALVPIGFYDENDIEPVKFAPADDAFGFEQNGDEPGVANRVMLSMEISGEQRVLLAAIGNNKMKGSKMEAILKILELPETASEADVLAAIGALKDAKAKLAATEPVVSDVETKTGLQLAAIPAAFAGVNETTQKLQLANARIEALNQDIAKEQKAKADAVAELDKIQLAAFVQDGQSVGKIGTVVGADGKNPDVEFWKQAWAVAPDYARQMLANAPVRYPANQKTGIDTQDAEPEVVVGGIERGEAIAQLAVKIQRENPGMTIEAANRQAEARVDAKGNPKK